MCHFHGTPYRRDNRRIPENADFLLCDGWNPAVYPDHGYPVFLPDLPDAEDPYNSGIGIQRDQEYNDHRAGEAGRAIISEFNKSGDKMHTKILLHHR